MTVGSAMTGRCNASCIERDEAINRGMLKCQVYNYTELLNMAFICDRTVGHAASFVILYLLVSFTAMVSNASVVLASIVERWKEIDQFTFVFAVSLSFNHFLVAFLVYPLGVYTMLRTDGWGLGRYWCTFTAYCTSYFEILYMMHVVLIVYDMLIYRFTTLKEVVKVYLVKKVAMSLWVTALIPHLILIYNQDWFLTDGGTLGVSDKYIQCGDKKADNKVKENKTVIDCFTAYTSTTYQELYIYLTCFFILPVAYGAIYYTMLLYLRKRSMYKGNRKEELSEEDQLENARTFIQRYKASLCMVVVFTVTQLPKWITSYVALSLDTEHQAAMNSGDATKEDNIKGRGMVIKMDFLSFWTCMGSIFIPFCYMMTCPTYFHAVTATRPLFWLRKHGEIIHGRTYSRRLKDPERQAKPPVNTLEVPGQPRVRFDTVSKIYMNSIAEEISNGTDPASPNHVELEKGGEVIANNEAGHGEARPVSSPEDVLLMLAGTDRGRGSGESETEDEGVTFLDLSQRPADSENTRDIQPCGTPNPSRILSVTPIQSSTPISEEETLSRSFPAQPIRSTRKVVDVSLDVKHAAKRTLPVPRSSGMNSPVTSESYSTSSKL